MKEPSGTSKNKEKEGETILGDDMEHTEERGHLLLGRSFFGSSGSNFVRPSFL